MQEAAKSDPSIVVQTPPPPPRHRKWKEARMKKGQYINPAVAEIAKKIVSCIHQITLTYGNIPYILSLIFYYTVINFLSYLKCYRRYLKSKAVKVHLVRVEGWTF